ncbi:hypothetical protein [Streptomyces swartbergensis]
MEEVSSRSPFSFRTSRQESATADLAFVVITFAVFALVAFVTKGVAKL